MCITKTYAYLLLGVFRSTWTPRGAVIFPHQCLSKMPWCHTSFLHSKALSIFGTESFRATVVFLIRPLFIQKPDVPSSCARQPLYPKLISPSCCFTAVSVIRHVRSALNFPLGEVIPVQSSPVLVEQKRLNRMFLESKVSYSVFGFVSVYTTIRNCIEYKLAFTCHSNHSAILWVIWLVWTGWDRPEKGNKERWNSGSGWQSVTADIWCLLTEYKRFFSVVVYFMSSHPGSCFWF